MSSFCEFDCQSLCIHCVVLQTLVLKLHRFHNANPVTHACAVLWTTDRDRFGGYEPVKHSRNCGVSAPAVPPGTCGSRFGRSYCARVHPFHSVHFIPFIRARAPFGGAQTHSPNRGVHSFHLAFVCVCGVYRSCGGAVVQIVSSGHVCAYACIWQGWRSRCTARCVQSVHPICCVFTPPVSRHAHHCASLSAGA